MRILFVCLGNICRSPAAEAAFGAIAGGAYAVDSAGTGDWHVGEPPYAPMQRAARARGLDLSRLRARQFTADDFGRFDLIIAMDGDNIEAVERQRPAGNTTPVRLFTGYGPDDAGDAVPDPYFTRDFDGALELIGQCAAGLLRDLEDK